MLRHWLAGLGILVVSLPLGVVLTFVLLPLWRWIEASYGVESIGHSGPSEWCFFVCIGACALALGSLYVLRWKMKR